MTKDIGFAYALIVTFLIGLDQLFGTPHPDTKPARIFGVSLAKCSILAAVVLAVFISWNRYTAAVTPTETTGASVGSAGLSYGAVLTGGIKQLLGIGREERFAQIMQSMGQAFLYRRVCLVARPSWPSAAFCCCSRRPLWRRLPVPHAAAPWLALWAGRSALPRCISST